MKKTARIVISSIIILGVVILLVTIIANILVKNKIEGFLNEDLPHTFVHSYDDLSVHSLDGSILLSNPSLILRNEEDEVQHTFIKAENLNISNISYWDYLVNNEIHIGRIKLKNPELLYYKHKKLKSKDSIKDTPEVPKPIKVDRLEIIGSQISIFDNEKDSINLFTKNVSLQVDQIEVTNQTLSEKIPFLHKNIEAQGDTLFVKANPYDNLETRDFSIKDGNIVFNDIRYYTKYSKAELSKIIPVERDHYDLGINSISMEQFDFGNRDTTFFAKSKKVILDAPSLNIYRDKLVTDDESFKPLYSRSIRQIPFDLTVDSVKVSEGYLKYSERVEAESPAGYIDFKNFKADIANLSNTYKGAEKTEITITALFMKSAPIKVDWNFDVQDQQDQFVFKAHVSGLEADKLNPFTEPNLNVRLEGTADETYFTIDGNDDMGTSNLRIKYSDFKVSLLQKEKKKKNKFLSAIVNIFVSKDSDKEDDLYSEGKGEAKRNKTKSIFNLLWNSIKSALQDGIM